MAIPSLARTPHRVGESPAVTPGSSLCGQAGRRTRKHTRWAVAELEATSPRLRGRTSWAPDVSAPLRVFLRTESASAGLLAAAIVVALVWASVASNSYDSLWQTRFSIRVGRFEVGQDLRSWINNGLMT